MLYLLGLLAGEIWDGRITKLDALLSSKANGWPNDYASAWLDRCVNSACEREHAVKEILRWL